MDAEGWLTSELETFACAACGEHYGEGHIRLIAQREELFFVDLSCPHCGSQAVAIVTVQVDGETLGARDAEEETAERPARQPGEPHLERPAISVDDVIDAHAMLRDFDGDIDQLIARIEGARS